MTQTPRDLTPEPLTRPEQVAELVESIHEHRIFALDTEFITERTYRPQLALVQVATPDLVCVLDPLAGGGGRSADLGRRWRTRGS